MNILEDETLSTSWSYRANKGIEPNNVSCSSTQTYFWECDKGHYYPSTPLRRKYSGAGCGYCSGNRVLVGFNDMWTTNPSLATYLLDQTEGYSITEKSNKRLLWICNKNHVTCATPLVKGRRIGSGNLPCRICTNQEVLIGYNDLWTTDPSLASSLVNSEEGYTVTYGSGKYLTWSCGKHSWESTVRDIYHGNWCPRCSKSVSKPEEIILSMFSDSVSQFKVEKRLVVDVYIPESHLIIEYDGGRFHSNKYSYDLLKTNKLLSKGYKVVRIRENSPYYQLGPLPISNKSLMHISVTRDHKFKYLENIKDTIKEWVINDN